MKQHITLNQRQTDILTLLYRFRFLTRQHIQKLLNHKSHGKVFVWLNGLVESKLIKKDPSAKTATAYYSIGNEGRKWLIKNKLVKRPKLLDRIWRESGYSSTFREKCTFLADLYLELTDRSGGALRFWTKTDLSGIDHLIVPAPDAYFVVDQKSEAIRFFVELPSTPRTKNLIDHVERYVEYFFSNEWQENVSKKFPTVIILCSNQSAVKTTRRYIKENYADEPDLHFIVSSDRTLDKILPKKKA